MTQIKCPDGHNCPHYQKSHPNMTGCKDSCSRGQSAQRGSFIFTVPVADLKWKDKTFLLPPYATEEDLPSKYIVVSKKDFDNMGLKLLGVLMVFLGHLSVWVYNL